MNTKGLLILSLVANLVLAGAVGFFVTKKNDGSLAAASTQSSDKAPSKFARKNAAGSAENRAGGGTNIAVPQINWRMVESADYREYIDNLRSIGCPEETIRDIITADVNKLFEARAKEMRAASTNKFEFWKSGSMFAGMLDEEKIKQKQALAKEKRELLTTLLGVAPEEKADMAAVINPFADLLEFLPDGKQAKIVDLMQTMQAKMMKSFKDGSPDETDMKEVQKVQKEMEDEIAKI